MQKRFNTKIAAVKSHDIIEIRITTQDPAATFR